MACISSAERTRLLEQLEILNTQIENANTALTAALVNSEVEEYRTNTGEGSQMTKRRSPKELNELIDQLESRQSQIYRKLYGKSLQNMNMRRKSYNRGLYYRGLY